MPYTYDLTECCETCDTCVGACCFWDACEEIWKCVDTTEAGCAGLGGNFQGLGNLCTSGNCEDTCCITYEAGLPNDVPTDTPCFYQVCEEGWFTHTCTFSEFYFDCGTPETGVCPDAPGCLVLTDPPDVLRDTTYIQCKTGGTYPDFVTVTGATFNTGDAGLDAFLSGLMNTTYSVPQVHCTPINFKVHEGVGTYGGHTYNVTAVASSTGGGAGQTAGINVWSPTNGNNAYVARTQTPPAYDVYNDCFGTYIDCNTVFQLNGPANIALGTYIADITGANVESSSQEIL